MLPAGASIALLYTALVYGGVGTISSIKGGLEKEAKRVVGDCGVERTKWRFPLREGDKLRSYRFGNGLWVNHSDRLARIAVSDISTNSYLDMSQDLAPVRDSGVYQ